MKSWKSKATELHSTPKWLKQGTNVTIDVPKSYDETLLNGKFGERKVYIVTTEEYGKIYVGETAFAKLAAQIAELPDGVDTLNTVV